MKSFLGSTPLTPYTIVQFGANDDTVVPCVAATNASIGVVNELGLTAADIAAGNTCDVYVGEIAEVVLGGTVAAGAMLTSNATAQAVAAAPAAGTNNRIIGTALANGVSGDVIPVFINRSVMQG
ncbi:MAG: DUF2190 domain-containing protein [Methylomonas sp.]|nr:MAG: DUF2190 domain-containing protein [Methylomonas sp.]